MPNTANIHFGAVLDLGIQDTVAEARWLEDLGYEYVGAPEHFMRGIPTTPSAASIPVLAVAAGATVSIRLVSSVLLLPFYHPTMLAKLTSTLYVASGGRLTLGVGIGGEFPAEFDALGIPLKERGERSNECLDALKKLWAGEDVEFLGRHFILNDVTVMPHPTQKPHPPIWVAGRKEPAMRRAARFGDGWFPYLYSPERYKRSAEIIKDIAEGEGRDLSTFQWANFQFISIYESRELAIEMAADMLGRGYQYHGSFRDIVKRYCIAGTVSDCIKRIQEYVDVGVTSFLMSWACPIEDRPRHIETFAKSIMPHFLA